MVQKLELDALSGPVAEAEGVVTASLASFEETRLRKEAEILNAREGAGKIIKAELIRAFSHLPSPQDKGICVSLGFNNKREDTDGFGTLNAFTSGEFLRASVVMYPDGLYLIPMVPRDRRPRGSNPRGRFFARYEVPLRNYVYFADDTIGAMKKNLVEQQPILHTTHPNVDPKELSFEEVFPEEEIIELTDPERRARLESKKAEYMARLQGDWAGNYDHMMRVQILDVLLREGKVNMSVFDDPNWRTPDGKYENFEKAWLIIKDYAETGGKNIS